MGTSLVYFQSNGLQFTRTIFSNSTPLLRCRLQKVKKGRVTISRQTLWSFNCPCCHVYLNKVMSDDVSIFNLEAFILFLSSVISDFSLVWRRSESECLTDSLTNNSFACSQVFYVVFDSCFCYLNQTNLSKRISLVCCFPDCKYKSGYSFSFSLCETRRGFFLFDFIRLLFRNVNVCFSINVWLFGLLNYLVISTIWRLAPIHLMI